MWLLVTGASDRALAADLMPSDQIDLLTPCRVPVPQQIAQAVRAALPSERNKRIGIVGLDGREGRCKRLFRTAWCLKLLANAWFWKGSVGFVCPADELMRASVQDRPIPIL
ncbi:hypothetical protein [Sphingobium sp.]|uniref:hypothetical protein n=1 Tax=Sphingobium sp. TaxID=1912891 RepID=UPI003B3BA79D